MTEVVKLILELVVGLLVATPLVIQLVKYVVMAVKEKNWKSLLPLVYDFIAVAETKFDNGAERKEWVLDRVVEAANTVNCNVKREEIGKLIDNAVELTKLINKESKK